MAWTHLNAAFMLDCNFEMTTCDILLGFGTIALSIPKYSAPDLRWSGGTVLWLFNVSWVVTDWCSASVQAACEPIISSSLLVIAWNKYVWPSKCILFQPCKYINTHNFSISSLSPSTWIFSAVCSEIVLLWKDKRVCLDYRWRKCYC